VCGVHCFMTPPGPAGRWFIERLKQIPVSMAKVPSHVRQTKG